jgi:hypothetical protein
MSDSTALVPRDPSALDPDGLDPDPADPSSSTALVPYRAPIPGRTWRSAARFAVLVGGSAAIGIGVATGGLTVAGAALLAVTLATGQVLAQTWRQNRLGPSSAAFPSVISMPPKRRPSAPSSRARAA